jgi:hypothetical protein
VQAGVEGRPAGDGGKVGHGAEQRPACLLGLGTVEEGGGTLELADDRLAGEAAAALSIIYLGTVARRNLGLTW